MHVISLSTYPIDNPLHGGQHRLANIVDAYRKDGHEVRALGVLGADHYAQSEGFLPFPGGQALGRFMSNTFLMEDWCIGQWAARDDGGFGRLSSLIGQTPDILHVEQPWLFEFAKRFAGSLPARRRPKLIYGSENVEHLLKQRIVSGYMGAQHAQACADLVLACERAALAAADLVAAVSEHDVSWSREHTRAPVVLAPNGVADRTFTDRDIDEANRLTGHRQFALYTASAHPPNVTGFFDLFGVGIGCLAPNQRLIVAGSAGPAITGSPQARRTPGLQSQLIAAGEVSEGVLSALLALAHTMVLPLTQGGGTNLKTAEALWSGHHVVATPTAMRGFERFSGSQGVHCAPDGPSFLAAVRDTMSSPALRLTREERAARRSVLWSSCLQDLVKAVGSMRP